MPTAQEQPVVSIIVPMYNVALYIEECLVSLKEQTIPFECWLVDDGSTDETASIVNTMIENDARFQLLRGENRGPAHARNRGLEKAKGTYLLFVDSDDKLAPDALTALVSTIEANDVGMVLGKTLRFNDSRTWGVPSHDKHHLYETGIKTLQGNPELCYAIGPAAKLFKRSLIGDGKFDEDKQFAEDQLFVLQQYIKSNQIAVLDEVVYYYRVRGKESQSLTQAYKKDTEKNLNNILETMMLAYNWVMSYDEQQGEGWLIAYYSRLFEIELRVLLKANLLNKGSEQQKGYQLFNQTYLQAKYQYLFGQCETFYHYVIKEQLDYLFLIKHQGMIEVKKILRMSQKSNGFDSYLGEKEREKVKGLLEGNRWDQMKLSSLSLFQQVNKKIGW